MVVGEVLRVSFGVDNEHTHTKKEDKFENFPLKIRILFTHIFIQETCY